MIVNVAPLAITVDPDPAITPPVQLKLLPEGTVTIPEPCSEPEDSAQLPAPEAMLKLTVPPETLLVPVTL